mgnify:FL=1
MAVNVVSYAGRTLVDLRDATATAPVIQTGYTAYGADGEKIIGTGPEILRREVTLPADGWTDGQKTVSVPGVTADNMVIVAVDRWGVACVAQEAGALTFAYSIQPPVAVGASVAIINYLT